MKRQLLKNWDDVQFCKTTMFSWKTWWTSGFLAQIRMLIGWGQHRKEQNISTDLMNMCWCLPLPVDRWMVVFSVSPYVIYAKLFHNQSTVLLLCMASPTTDPFLVFSFVALVHRNEGFFWKWHICTSAYRFAAMAKMKYSSNAVGQQMVC